MILNKTQLHYAATGAQLNSVAKFGKYGWSELIETGGRIRQKCAVLQRKLQNSGGFTQLTLLLTRNRTVANIAATKDAIPLDLIHQQISGLLGCCHILT